nr:uncharacterized protein LOC127330329 [Lolium perenne]
MAAASARLGDGGDRGGESAPRDDGGEGAPATAAASARRETAAASVCLGEGKDCGGDASARLETARGRCGNDGSEGAPGRRWRRARLDAAQLHRRPPQAPRRSPPQVPRTHHRPRTDSVVGAKQDMIDLTVRSKRNHHKDWRSC